MTSKSETMGSATKRSGALAVEAEIISAPEACQILGIHRTTLYRLIEDRQVPAFRLSRGGRWRFNRKELREWLNDRQARGGSI